MGTYANHGDIKSFLQLENDFSVSTRPTDTEVEELISWAEDRFDNETLKSLSLIANIDGTTISFGNKYVFTSNTASDKSVTVLDSSHIVIFYKDSNNSNYGVSLVGKINNDVITFPYKYRYFNQDSVSGVSSINMDNTSFVVIFTDNENSNYGTSLVGTPFRQPFDSPLNIFKLLVFGLNKAMTQTNLAVL